MKMDSDHLYRHSKPYALLRKITSFYHSLYYENISVVNIENIPSGDPVIFTPVHQNALMDALAIIYTADKQPVFMARADIFKKDVLRKILTSLKIIPVYRIRDGKEALSNNDSSFELAFQVLKSNGAVGIMPEGNHGEQRRLRPLKKGVARLAIQAQELLGKKASIKIVPVGLEYSNYYTFRSNLLVIYGKPIDITDYLDEYKINAAKGLQLIRTRLSDELKSIMIDIDTDEYYDTIYEAKELYSYSKREDVPDLYDKFLLEKNLTDKLVSLSNNNPEKMRELKSLMLELTSKASALKLKPWIFSWNPPLKSVDWFSDILRYTVFFPVFIFAALFHAVPYISSEILSHKTEDKQFVSTMRFVISFLFYLLWYFFILIMPFSIIMKGILLLTMPIFGIISYDYWDSLKKANIKFRFLLLKHQKSKELFNTQKLFKELIQWLEKR